jgi:Flp pilus assembly pilin Flp
MMLRCPPSAFRRLVRNRRGVTFIEYAVLAGAISVAAVAVLNNIGQKFQDALSAVGSALN